MRVRVNGEEMDLADGMTVGELLGRMGIEARPVAVERNREIVSRSRFAQTVLEDGDQLEVVTFVGGG